jgi:hypothetical protein
MKRKRLTSDEARTLDTTLTKNALIVATTLECRCEPYRDVFTFRRWLAQGQAVRQGEKGLRLLYIGNEEQEGPDGTVEMKRVKSRSVVFCRCQVATLPPKTGHIPAGPVEPARDGGDHREADQQ